MLFAVWYPNESLDFSISNSHGHIFSYTQENLSYLAKNAFHTLGPTFGMA